MDKLISYCYFTAFLLNIFFIGHLHFHWASNLRMTDYIFEGYTRRCWKQFRDFAEYYQKTISLPKEYQEKAKGVQLLQKFHACFLRPLVPIDIKEAYTKCIVSNDGDVSKCREEYTRFRKKGLLEFYDLMVRDNYGNIRSQLIAQRCPQYVEKSRKLLCHSFPEQPECVQLKEKAFHCVADTACREIYNISSECFVNQQRKNEAGLMSYIFRGENVITKTSEDDYCREVQGNLLKCFEKYFFTSTIIDPDENFTIDVADVDEVPPNLTRKMLENSGINPDEPIILGRKKMRAKIAE